MLPIASLLLILATFLVLVPAAGADTDSVVTPDSAFVVAVPADWKQAFEDGTETVHVTEFMPVDQTVQDWRDMLAVYVIVRQAAPMPADYLMGLVGLARNRCDSGGVRLLGEHAGLPPDDMGRAVAAERLDFVVLCGAVEVETADGKRRYGEVGVYSARRGPAGLFVAKRAWRTEPFDAGAVPVSAPEVDAAAARVGASRTCRAPPDVPSLANTGRVIDVCGTRVLEALPARERIDTRLEVIGDDWW